MEEEIACDDGSRVKLLDIDDEMLLSPPMDIVERYYSRYFSADGDVCVLHHHNGLCIVTLSDLHPIVTSKELTVTKVELRADVHAPKGKHKRQGTFVQEETILCTIYAGEEKFVIRANLRGVLLELNHTIVENANLLKNHCQKEGFIAIVMPKAGMFKTCCEKLLSREEYCLAKEKLPSTTTTTTTMISTEVKMNTDGAGDERN